MVGYKAKPLGSVKKKYICPICLFIVKTPIQTIRGEIACQKCYTQHFDSKSKICPIDKEIVNETPIFSRDYCVEKESLQIACRCVNSECDWIGVIGQSKAHLRACNFTEKICPDCNTLFLLKEKDKHARTCLKRSVHCQYCLQLMDALHEKGCAMRPLCPYGCGHQVDLSSLSFHMETCEIVGKEGSENGNCLYERFGCHYRSNTTPPLIDGNQQLHLQTELKNHLACSNATILLLIQNLQKQSQEIVNLKRDVARLLEDRTNFGLALDKELERRFNLLENISYDGCLRWRLENVSQHLMKPGYINSHPTYTSRNGYKFCLRVYLNGDGNGQGSHLSLFFVIMKSDYDIFLPWPFNKTRIDLKLAHPNNEYANVVQTMHLSELRSSSSFERPQLEMNRAIGCTVFLKKERLNSFIFNDTLYFEAVVR